MIELAIVLKVIATFNHTWERADVVGQNARLPNFEACWQQERSQMYFRATRIRAENGTNVVDAEGTRFGVHGRQAAPAVFVLKKEGADWKVDSLRVFEPCLDPKQ